MQKEGSEAKHKRVVLVVLLSDNSQIHKGLQKFRELFPDGKVYDLSQNATKRARLGNDAFPTFTKSCSSMWIVDAERQICTLT